MFKNDHTRTNCVVLMKNKPKFGSKVLYIYLLQIFYRGRYCVVASVCVGAATRAVGLLTCFFFAFFVVVVAVVASG